MQKQFAFIALLSAVVAGCAGHTSTETSDPRLNQAPSAAGAKIQVHAEGGIAALAINQVVRYDDRYYVTTTRHICNDGCAALDSASGTLPAAATDALFNTVFAQSPFSLKDDYGITRNGADMMAYTISITINGSTKVVRADDGTMPPQLSQIASAVRETIAAARK